MALRMTQRREDEVPAPNGSGRRNEDLRAVKDELSKLATGMVLEIETGNEQAVRSTKVLVTKASKELGKPFRHWHEGTKVFAKPLETARRRGRPRKSADRRF